MGPHGDPGAFVGSEGDRSHLPHWADCMGLWVRFGWKKAVSLLISVVLKPQIGPAQHGALRSL